MIRQLFTVASVLSLLVWLAAAGGWCASYRRPKVWASKKWLSGSPPGVHWTMNSDKG